MSLIGQLLLALSIDAAVGEPKWLWSRAPHPAVLMGRLVTRLDTSLNRSSGARVAGIVALLIMVAVAGLAGWFITLGGDLITVLAAAILLAHRSLVDHVRAVAGGLRLSPAAGRSAVAMIVSRDVREATPSAVARSALESLSENFSDGVIAPAFWFLVAGLPGLVIYKMVNTADSMIGYLTPRHAAFGWAAARCDDLLNWIPARLTALLIALAGGAMGRWPAIRQDAAFHRSPNAGWPEAALAHSLDYALAGPRTYHGELRDLAWVNPAGRRTLGAADIDAGLMLVWRSWGILVLVLAIIGGLIWIF